MADFVEKATLLLIDQSTPNINKINAALSALMKTAAKPIVLKIDSSQLKTALGTLQALNRAQQASNRTQARSNLAGLQNRAAQAEIAAIARQHAADTRRQVAADMAGAKISQARAASM